jgi:surface polysaccharide O-acyltransferase-like enzyme
MKHRLREIDYLRVFAAFSVIAIHITSGYTVNSRAAFVLNQVVRYAVPLFIILSGFAVYHSGSGRDYSSSGFWRRRLGKILWPYVFWSLFYSLYAWREFFRVSGWGALLQPDRLLLLSRQLLCGTGYYHLYFLLIIAQLYLLYPWLRRLLQKKPLSFLGLTFFLTLLSQAGIYLHQIKIITLPDIGIPYVSLFPLWLFYFVLGMYLAAVKEWQSFLRGKGILCVVIWLAGLSLLLVDSSRTKTGDSSVKPSIMLYSLSAYFFFYGLAVRFKAMKKVIRIGKSRVFATIDLDKTVNRLSAQSFLLYLLHPLVLDQLLLLRSGMPFLWQSKAGMFGLFMAVAVITLVLTYIACYIPFIHLIGGVYVKGTKHK